MTFVSTSGQISSKYTSAPAEIKYEGIISSTDLNFYNLLKKFQRINETISWV